MLEYIEEKQVLKTKKQRHFKFVYNLNNNIIECNLNNQKMTLYYNEFIKMHNENVIDFCLFVANKTHYHKIKYNNINYSRDTNVKRHRMIKDDNLKILSWHKYDTPNFYK